MTKRRLLIILSIPVLLIFILISIFVSIFFKSNVVQSGEEGLGWLGLLFAGSLFSIMAILFYSIFPAFLIFIHWLADRIKKPSLKFKKGSYFLVALRAIIEGLFLSLVSNVLITIIYLYVYIPYLMYRYTNTKEKLTPNQEKFRERLKKGYILRIVIIVITSLLVSLYFQLYNKNHTPNYIDIFS